MAGQLQPTGDSKTMHTALEGGDFIGAASAATKPAEPVKAQSRQDGALLNKRTLQLDVMQTLVETVPAPAAAPARETVVPQQIAIAGIAIEQLSPLAYI